MSSTENSLKVPQSGTFKEFSGFYNSAKRCIEHGTELGWLLDPEDENILVIFSDRSIQIFEVTQILPVLDDIDLNLTAEQIFEWLRF